MKPYSGLKGLIIGVGRYADPQYDLSYARSDAEAVADTLKNEFGFDPIWTLYDADATRQNIRRFFEQDLQEADEDDGLVIFFAGHGITVTSTIGDDRGFLVPHDGDPKQPYANISLTAVRDDYLPMIPAKHVFLIVDACYSGLALRDVATVERAQSIDETVLAELTRRDRKVRQVLAAGTKDQKVLDGGLFGHSVFTGRLIEALREADPYITADHVGVHLRARVARDGADRGHQQTPQFGYLIGGEGCFVFHRKTVVGEQQVLPASQTPVERTGRPGLNGRRELTASVQAGNASPKEQARRPTKPVLAKRNQAKLQPEDWLKGGLLIAGILLCLGMLFGILVRSGKPEPGVSPEQLIARLEQGVAILKSVHDEQSAVKASVQFQLMDAPEQLVDIKKLRPPPTAEQREQIANLISQLHVEAGRIESTPELNAAMEKGMRR